VLQVEAVEGGGEEVEGTSRQLTLQKSDSRPVPMAGKAVAPYQVHHHHHVLGMPMATMMVMMMMPPTATLLTPTCRWR
jgi:hypothetical protein